MQKNIIHRKYFRTPFSADYWRQAFSELKNTRTLVFAALILALRIAMKPLKIPIAADVNITFGFIVNALGSMVYGPIVALLSGAVSDTLGYLIAPSGVYYFPFIFLEMGGSLIFALFLYSTDITPIRLILAKFCVNMFVNVLLNEPIMVLYYRDVLHLTTYQPFVLVRIVKNIVMLPVEAIILMVVFRAVIPALTSAGYRLPGKMELNYTKRHIILLAVLFVIGAASVTGYLIYDYNNKSFSADYTAAERLQKNTEMNAWVTEERPELKAEETVTTTGTDALNAVVESVVYGFVHTTLFVLFFLALTLLLNTILKAMDLVFRLPGLHFLNTAGGALFGVVEGALLLFFAVWVLRRMGVSFETELFAGSRILHIFTTYTPMSVLAVFH